MAEPTAKNAPHGRWWCDISGNSEGRKSPALLPGFVVYTLSNATLQSPHTTLTCFVARMIAPHTGQTYLMLRFLLAWRPPRMVVVVGVSSPSSSPEVVVINNRYAGDLCAIISACFAS